MIFPKTFSVTMRRPPVRLTANRWLPLSRKFSTPTTGSGINMDGRFQRSSTINGRGMGTCAFPGGSLGSPQSLYLNSTRQTLGQLLSQPRCMSSTSTAATASSSSGSEQSSGSGDSSGDKAKGKDGGSNIFLDNLGKIFLAVIASVIATLVRSSISTTNRNKVRDHLQQIAALDPVEIDELRIANSQLTPDVFRAVTEDLFQTGLSSSSSSSSSNDEVPVCTYREFVFSVRKTMVRLRGEPFTVQMGHLIDRAVADIMEHENVTADTPMPVSLWLTALSLGLNSSVRDRIRILYDVLKLERQKQQPMHDEGGGGNYDPVAAVTFAQIPPLVGYLQSTCQLPPDTQIVPTDEKYPTQQWERGRPKDLVPWDGTDRDAIDLHAFASILRSKSVCAWGECYQKRKFDKEDDV